jgi:hypothetical protein
MLNPSCSCKTRARATYTSTTLKQRLLVRGGLEGGQAVRLCVALAQNVGGDDIRVLGQHNGLYRLSGGGEWQIAAEITGMTYVRYKY